MKRPALKSPCVADRNHAPNERIAEFTFPSGRGGLLALRTLADGSDVVEVYRLDEGVAVVGPRIEDPERLAKELSPKPTYPDGRFQLYSPEDTLIVGTSDTVDVSAWVEGFEADHRGDPDPVYTGTTAINWDSQTTTSRDGSLVGVDEDGREWLLSECTPRATKEEV